MARGKRHCPCQQRDLVVNTRLTIQSSAAQHAQTSDERPANQRVLRLPGLCTPNGAESISTSQRAQHMMRMKTLALCALASTVLANPALAASKPVTRLVKCGAESCLKISGQRADKTSSVFINGHEVPAKGAHRWNVRLPVNEVRSLSSPYARTIAVSVAGVTQDARLPIGMMGHADLAMLVVRVK